MIELRGKDNRCVDYMSRNFNINEDNYIKDVNFIQDKLIKDKKIEDIQKNIKIKNKEQMKKVKLGSIKVLVDQTDKIILPNNFKSKEFLINLHKRLGHPGQQKFFSTLKNYFCSKDLRKIINEIVEECVDCGKNKHNKVKMGRFMGYIEAETPLKKISSNLYSPIDLESFQSFGKIYLLTFTDLFSRYSKKYIVEEANGKEIRDKLINGWCKSMKVFPESILTDNGRQYIGTSFNNILEKSKIKHYYSSAYNPTGNFLSKRINQTIGVCLRSNKDKPIEEVIEIIQNRINKTVNRTLNYSPEKIIFKRSSINILDRKLEINKEEIRERITKKNENRIDKKKQP